MKVHFLLTRRVPPMPSPILVKVFDMLQQRGFDVESDIVEEIVTRPNQLSVKHDLYLLKSHTELSLSLAGVLHGLGAQMLNPYLSCTVTQDKITASQRLHAAGVPVPQTWVTSELSLLRSIAQEIPLILKPYRGHRGTGTYIVRTPFELDLIPKPETPMIIQEYIAGIGEDLKVYVVGEHVFAVRNTFSSSSFTMAGHSCEASPELRDIALRVGKALGLGLFELDVIESSKGPVVVDVNYFPSYKAVPDSAPLIANYIEDYANGYIQLVLPSSSKPITTEAPSNYIIFNK